jgi:phage recombination protein Bet
MSTDIALPGQHGTLAVVGDQHDWTPVQQAAFAHIGIEDAPDADKQVFHHVCQITGLDPFRKQIYMIGRKEKGQNGKPDRIKYTIQTAIDGFRVIAEDHPQYAGTLDPEWCGPDGVWRETWTEKSPPVMARVKVLRHDRAHPITLPVRFVEFAATFFDGGLQGQWKTKPAHMIAKVAEAAALRKAFPRQLAGVYTDDEMAHVDNQARRGHGVVVEQDAQSVTAAELTGRPSPPVGWSDQQWTDAIDTAYRDNDAEQLRMLWKKSLAERPDDEDLRERISGVATALKAAAEAGPTAPEDVVNAEIVDEGDPRDDEPAAAEPGADDAEAVAGFWAEQPPS